MMSVQLVSILVMFISGIAVGAIIDFIRINIQYIPLKNVRRVTWLFEWFVWLLLGITTFYLLFLVKGGQWRFVDPLAQIAGIATYELIFQKSVRFLGRLLFNLLIRPILFIGHVFAKIIRSIIRLVIGLFIFIFHPIYKVFKTCYLKIFKRKK